MSLVWHIVLYLTTNMMTSNGMKLYQMNGRKMDKWKQTEQKKKNFCCEKCCKTNTLTHHPYESHKWHFILLKGIFCSAYADLCVRVRVNVYHTSESIFVTKTPFSCNSIQIERFSTRAHINTKFEMEVKTY